MGAYSTGSLLVFYRGNMYVLHEVEYDYRGVETIVRKVENQAAGIVLSTVLDVSFPVCFHAPREKPTWQDVLSIAGSSEDMVELAATLYRKGIIMYPCMAAHRYLEGRMSFEEFHELHTRRSRRLILLASALGLIETAGGLFAGSYVQLNESPAVSVNGRRLRPRLLCPEYLLAEERDSGERVALDLRQVGEIRLLPESTYIEGLGSVVANPGDDRTHRCLLAI